MESDSINAFLKQLGLSRKQRSNIIASGYQPATLPKLDVAKYLPSLLNNWTGAGLTGAQREANEFTASQTQEQMAFQERMANTQYQRGVADMQAAGVNPALAYSQGGNVAPSGAAGSSVAPGAGMSMSELMQLMLLGPQKRLLEEQARNAFKEGQKTDEEISKIREEIRKTREETQGISLQNLLTETYGAQRADAELRQIEQSISESLARTGEAATRSALNSAMTDLTKVQSNSEELRQTQLKWEKKFIDDWHMTPALAGDLVKAAATLAGAGLVSATNLIKFFDPANKKGSITRKITVPAGEVVITKPLK